MAPEETIFDNLKRFDEQLRALIPADGIGIWTDGRFEATGIAPPFEAVADLVRFLNARPADSVFHTNELKRHLPDAVRYADTVAGVLSIPFSRAPKDFVFLFRREVLQTVTWGGDPNKAVDAESGRIGPRASFAAWKETVTGQSIPWLRGEIEIAETLRVSLLDIILRRANLVDRERPRRAGGPAPAGRGAEPPREEHPRGDPLAGRAKAATGRSRSTASSPISRTRLHALSVAHDQLTQSHWKAAPLSSLIEAEAQAWTNVGDARLVLDGPPVMIEARAYQTLALVLHEMMTNAAKYGALSAEGAQLRIAWSVEGDRGLELRWTETNGPAVVPPSRRGFGHGCRRAVDPV